MVSKRKVCCNTNSNHVSLQAENVHCKLKMNHKVDFGNIQYIIKLNKIYYEMMPLYNLLKFMVGRLTE